MDTIVLALLGAFVSSLIMTAIFSGLMLIGNKEHEQSEQFTVKDAAMMFVGIFIMFAVIFMLISTIPPGQRGTGSGFYWPGW